MYVASIHFRSVGSQPYITTVVELSHQAELEEGEDEENHDLSNLPASYIAVERVMSVISGMATEVMDPEQLAELTKDDDEAARLVADMMASKGEHKLN